MPRPHRPRPDDWPERLTAYVAALRDTPFAWGAHDCATFVADWVCLLRGVDPLFALRGAYHDEAGFTALVEAGGGLAPLVAAAASAAGIPPCPVPFAQRGDAVLARVGNEECLGLVTGARVAVPTLAGIRLAPRQSILAAWAV